ncbi:MAG: hypothetical protein ACJA0Q_000095 [Saprospiraceae bacterium]|jgi:hypothetical protein
MYSAAFKTYVTIITQGILHRNIYSDHTACRFFHLAISLFSLLKNETVAMAMIEFFALTKEK